MGGDDRARRECTTAQSVSDHPMPPFASPALTACWPPGSGAHQGFGTASRALRASWGWVPPSVGLMVTGVSGPTGCQARFPWARSSTGSSPGARWGTGTGAFAWKFNAWPAARSSVPFRSHVADPGISRPSAGPKQQRRRPRSLTQNRASLSKRGRALPGIRSLPACPSWIIANDSTPSNGLSHRRRQHVDR